MIKFFKDAISEIHNVTWPSKKHTKHISTVAIIFTFASAVFIWFIDYWFDKAVKSAVSAEQVQVSNVKVTTEDWKAANVEITTEDIKNTESENTESK